jgi:hypothetical protein
MSDTTPSSSSGSTDVAAIIAVVCFIEWGLIHVAAGFMSWLPFGGAGGASCTGGSAAGGLIHPALMSGMKEDEKASFTSRTYAIFANRLGIQHGWNLFYVGVWSISCAVPLLGGWRTAWGWGMHQYLFDWGYFAAIDWVETGNGIGEAQTFIVSIGLFCSALSVKHVHGDDVSTVELVVTLFIPCILFVAGLFNKFVRAKMCHTCMDCQLSEEEERLLQQGSQDSSNPASSVVAGTTGAEKSV